MAIRPKTKAGFKPCPPGVYRALCVDVLDIGDLDTPFGVKAKIEVRFQVDHSDPETDLRRYLVVQRYNNTLHPDSNLAAVAEALLGRPLGEAERYDSDLEELLLGRTCQIEVGTHESKKGGVFAHIERAMPLARGMEPMEMDGYVRVCDREEGAA